MVRECFLFHMTPTCLLTDALRSVQRSQHQRGTLVARNQGDNNDNRNNDDDLPGEFDGDEPDNLLMHVEGSKSSAPATSRTSRILPNPRAEVEQEATSSISVARNTEQVRRLSLFHMTTDSSDVRCGLGSCQ